MRTQKIKFITALFLGLTSLSTLNASNPLADEATQKEGLVRKIVEFENPRIKSDFLVTFLNINFDCDFPILESLKHNVPTPTIEETTAFLKLVNNKPNFKAKGLSDDKVHGIRKLAEAAFDFHGQRKYKIFLPQKQLRVLPRLLGALTNLQELFLSDNQISDIRSLGALTNLKELYLEYNKISDIRSLGALTNLQELCLYNNQISDIRSLGALTNLRMLSLYNNKISDIRSLGALTNLQKLFLPNNQISDIRSLGGLDEFARALPI